MQTNNGYLSIQQQGDDTVLIAVELDSALPAGARSATVLLDRHTIEELITDLTRLREATRDPLAYSSNFPPDPN